MKRFFPINEKGNVEISQSRLKEILSDVYEEGYAQGKCERVIDNAPKFELSSKKETVFHQKEGVLIFRATIL